MEVELVVGSDCSYLIQTANLAIVVTVLVDLAGKSALEAVVLFAVASFVAGSASFVRQVVAKWIGLGIVDELAAARPAVARLLPDRCIALVVLAEIGSGLRCLDARIHPVHCTDGSIAQSIERAYLPVVVNRPPTVAGRPGTVGSSLFQRCIVLN